MQVKDYPAGRGAAKPKYVNGVLMFDVGPLVPGVTHTLRHRVTAAEVNAGHVVLPAIPGFKYRIVDCKMIAIGGNAATATSVDLLATQGASAVRPVVNTIAATFNRSVVLRMGAGGSTVLGDGASFAAMDANTAISITKQTGGSGLGTASHIDLLLDYTVEK
jgi:hypothetical protein